MPDQPLLEKHDSEDTELQHLHLQIRLKSLDLAHLRLQQKEDALRNREPVSKAANYWTSPAMIAVITGILGLIAALLANVVQGRANVELERQKFESAAFLKAIDTQDTDKAAKLLVFMVKTRLLNDPTGRIAALESHPEQTPLLPPSPHAPSDESRLARLQPSVADMARRTILNAKHAGIDVLVTSGYRSPEEQAMLYAKGRTAPGNIVTFDLPGKSPHDCGLAFDVIIIDSSGSPVTNPEDPRWSQLVSIAQAAGLTWGGESNNNHFQIDGSCSDALAPQR